MPIKAITFDFWSTLYKPRAIDYSQRLQKLKTTIEQYHPNTLELDHFESAVAVARNGWNRGWMEDQRTMGAEEWLGIVLDELKITLATDDRVQIQTNMENRILSERPTLVPEAQPVLAELAKSYHLAVISDTGLTPGRALRQIMADDEIIDYFSHLTFSDELGRSKPHPQAFLTTLEAVGASPDAAIHVGDLLRTDIAGAQGVGMQAVQYIGVSQDQPETTATAAIIPDAVIENHRDLITLAQR